MSLTNPYCTVAEVQAEMRNSDSEYLTAIENAINNASRYIDEWVGHDFLYHDYLSNAYKVRILGYALHFPWPIISITEIAIKGGVLDLTDLEIEGYSADLSGVLTGSGSNVRNGFISGDPEALSFASNETRRASVKGTFGWALDVGDPTGTPPPTLPSTIRRAAILIASHWSGEYRVERAGFDGTRVSLSTDDIPAEAMKLIQRHKKIVA